MCEGETPEQSLSSPLSPSIFDLPPRFLPPAPPRCSSACILYLVQGPPIVHSRELHVPAEGGATSGERGRAGRRRGEAGRGSSALETEEQVKAAQRSPRFPGALGWSPQLRAGPWAFLSPPMAQASL